MKLFELTKALIKIPSPTGEEAAAVHFLKAYLESSGFVVDLQTVEKGRSNIFAKIGEPEVVFSTHIDTVKPFLDFKEDKHTIYGRGACDAKGILAAQIKAVERLIESGWQNIGLLIVVGEEGGSDGAKAANQINNNCRLLICGEPTDNKLAVGTKGALRVEVQTKGKAGHSAYPEQGESAILKLLKIIHDWQKIQYPKDSTLGRTTWNIGIIEGGSGANVIPDFARAEMMFRLVTDISSIKKLLESNTKIESEIDYTFEIDPIKMDSVIGFDTKIVSFATDVPLLSNWGTPYLLGPGSILKAHTMEESISKKELVKAVNLYCTLANEVTS
ncbi:MAG: M20/M25/M40 family metallo-hydrolase [bacterium]